MAFQRTEQAGRPAIEYEADICSVMGYKGKPTIMVNALLKCGFLEKHESGFFQLHDWKEHNPYACKSPERIARAKKGAAARIENLLKRRLTGSYKQNQAELQDDGSSAPAPDPSPVPSLIEKGGFPTSKNNSSGQSHDAMGRPLKTFK